MISIPRSLYRIPLLRGIFRMAIEGWAGIFHGRCEVQNRLGLQLLIDHENAVDRQIYIAGSWEPRCVDLLFGLVEQERQKFKGEAVFLDVGSHWGLYSLLAYKTGWFDRVVAFEPDPVNYAQLQANLFLNEAVGAIEALPLAASNRAATFGLTVRTQRNRGGTRLAEEGEEAKAICQAVRLDDQLDFEGKLLVMKMDVESHELAALEGAMSLIARNHCVLQIEIWSATEELLAQRLPLITEQLARHGIERVAQIDSDYFFVSKGATTKRDVSR
jgi:FkbM family methyltransferase